MSGCRERTRPARHVARRSLLPRRRRARLLGGRPTRARALERSCATRPSAARAASPLQQLRRRRLQRPRPRTASASRSLSASSWSMKARWRLRAASGTRRPARRGARRTAHLRLGRLRREHLLGAPQLRAHDGDLAAASPPAPARARRPAPRAPSAAAAGSDTTGGRLQGGPAPEGARERVPRSRRRRGCSGAAGGRGRCEEWRRAPPAAAASEASSCRRKDSTPAAAAAAAALLLLLVPTLAAACRCTAPAAANRQQGRVWGEGRGGGWRRCQCHEQRASWCCYPLSSARSAEGGDAGGAAASGEARLGAGAAEGAAGEALAETSPPARSVAGAATSE